MSRDGPARGRPLVCGGRSRASADGLRLGVPRRFALCRVREPLLPAQLPRASTRRDSERLLRLGSRSASARISAGAPAPGRRRGQLRVPRAHGRLRACGMPTRGEPSRVRCAVPAASSGRTRWTVPAPVCGRGRIHGRWNLPGAAGLRGAPAGRKPRRSRGDPCRASREPLDACGVRGCSWLQSATGPWVFGHVVRLPDGFGGKLRSRTPRVGARRHPIRGQPARALVAQPATRPASRASCPLCQTID